MKTRPLGPGAPAVTAVGFGGMHLSIQGRPASEAEAIKVVHAVLDGGVTLLDTANVYCLDEKDIGHNERLFAKALKTWRGTRSSVVVATKGGITRSGRDWGVDGRPAHLLAACDRSLKALGVERIDLYQLHRPDPAVPFLESVGALAELQRKGKIRWIGLSNVSVEQIEAARTIVTVVTVQNRLNPFFREALETGVVAHCEQHGIGFLAYSPVGGGRLNLKLPTHPSLTPMARRNKVSTHAAVLAWCLSKGKTVIVIPSARTVEHAVDSLTAADLTLSIQELAVIDGAEFSRA